jgi:hypothetical protein
MKDELQITNYKLRITNYELRESVFSLKDLKRKDVPS